MFTAVGDDSDLWRVVTARACCGAASLRVTAAYAVMLLTVSATLTALGPDAHRGVVSRMSTNLDNLARGHVGTLVGSAFVSDGADILAWLPGLVCLLALAELTWRSSGLLLTFAVGHIGATLLVAVGLIAAVQTRWLPMSVACASDVGISYGAMCVLGALTASIPRHWRPIWPGWWLGIAAVAALGTNFAAVGHVFALLMGIGLSSRLPSVADWKPVRVVLLSGGAVFAYFLLAGPFAAAPVAGLAGALIALLARQILRSHRGNGAEQTESKHPPNGKMSTRQTVHNSRTMFSTGRVAVTGRLIGSVSSLLAAITFFTLPVWVCEDAIVQTIGLQSVAHRTQPHFGKLRPFVPLTPHRRALRRS